MYRKFFYVYIMCSKRNGTLYIGVTNDISRRIVEHKSSILPGFSTRYKVNRLVYYEEFDSIEAAILREKQLKAWKRSWKMRIIEEVNPDWLDLSESDLMG